MQRSFYRSFVFLAFIGIAIGFIFPNQYAIAEIPATAILAQSNTEFNRGRYSLTGSIQETSSNGGVQLVPIGTMKLWTPLTNNSMCEPVTDMGNTSFNEHIYSIGGSVRATSSSPVEIVDTICHTKVISSDGILAEWAELTPQVVSGPDNAFAARTSTAAIAVAAPNDPSGRGILIIAGGLDTNQQSQNEVWSAIINSDGSLTSMRAEIATADFRAGMGIASYTSPTTGKTFVYLLGGYDKFQGPITLFNSVLRAEVLAINGDNARLSAWTKLSAAIPMPNINQPECQDLVGLYANKVVTMDILTSPAETVLVSMGGLAAINDNTIPSCSSTNIFATTAVFFATIDPDTGDLDWNTTEYSLPQPLSQLGAIALDAKVYTAGGALGVNQSDATNLVMSSYMTPTLPLGFPPFGESNFLQNTAALQPQWARLGHGMVIIQNNGRPLTYIFGGKDDNGTYLQDTLRGYVGLPQDLDFDQAGYATEGVYQSEVYELAGPGAVTRMKWSTTLPVTYNTDIVMSYRIGDDSNFTGSTDFTPLDVDLNSANYSVNGVNEFTFDVPTQIGRYFQFKALLKTNSPEFQDATPILRGPVEISYTIDGYPNLVITQGAIDPIDTGVVINSNIKIGNQRPANSTETLLDADIESAGSFFVFMYTFEPGQPVVIPTPNAEGQYPLSSIAAFAEINRSNLPADQIYTIPNASWKQYCDTAPNCSAANWKLVFNKIGTWNVVVVVDGNNNVTEADAPNIDWETDNTFTFQVQSNFTGEGTYLPIVRRFVPPTP